MVGKLALAVGIPDHLNPYDLHHTTTSVLSASGVAPELLADLLGHVDTRMVFKHYRHPVTPAVDVAAKNIDRALRDSSGLGVPGAYRMPSGESKTD